MQSSSGFSFFTGGPTSTPGAPAPSDAAGIFAALGDETRLKVLMRLASEGPGSITQLTAQSQVSRQTVTKHLTVLSEAGLVRGFRQGREHIWELAPERLSEAQVYLNQISRQWDDALDRLKRFVEVESPE